MTSEALECTRGWNSVDDRGYTPLHFAAQYSRLENVRLLLSYGAFPDKKSTMEGRHELTPLQLAFKVTIQKFNSVFWAHIGQIFRPKLCNCH